MRVSQLLLCLQSHSSLCSVSPPFCIGPCYHETWVSVKQGRAQQGCWSRDMPVSPALMPGRGRCVLGCCCWIFLFQGTYSSRQAGIVATAVTGVGVLLAVVIFLIYCKSKGWKNFHLPAVEATNTDAGAGYLTVYAQVGPYQEVHLWSCSKAQQDNSKRTLASGVETSKTIYSTIQALAQLQTDDEKMSNSMLGCQKQDEKSPYSSVC